MKANDLFNIIIMNKKEEGIPSLPFAFSDKDGNRGLAWFYYRSVQEEDKVRTAVREIAMADEDLNYLLQNVNWKFDYINTEKTVLTLSVKEFYRLLEEKYNADSLNASAMKELLEKAVPSGMLEVYQKASQYAADHLNDLMKTDQDTKKDKNEDRKDVLDELLTQTASFRK